jgi:hypothetical protein
MKPRTRDRATRVILASLINSDLTAAELAEIARLFETVPAFTIELGQILSETAAAMGVRGARTAAGRKASRPANDHEAVAGALQIIKKKRLPKHEVRSIIEQIYPVAYRAGVDSEMTVDDLVRTVIERGDDRMLSQFIDMLRAGRPRPDEYLKGIMEHEGARQ